MKGNLLLLENLLEHSNNKNYKYVTSISKNVYIYVYKLDVEKLVPVPDFVKNDVCNAKIKNINITNLATKTILNAKINEIKGEISDVTNLSATSALTSAENIIRSVCNLIKIPYL